MDLGLEARVELHNVVEVVQEVLDAVDVGDYDELGEADEEVRPPRSVVVELQGRYKEMYVSNKSHAQRYTASSRTRPI